MTTRIHLTGFYKKGVLPKGMGTMARVVIIVGGVWSLAMLATKGVIHR